MMGLTPPLEGGSERHIFEVSSRLKCDVLTQNGSSCRNKIEIPIIGSGFIRNISFFISSFVYSLYLLFRTKKIYEVIHIHENLLYFLAPLLRLRYKVVITVHGIKGFKFYDNKKLWKLFSFGLRRANLLIAVNMEDRIKLEKYFEKVDYIPNGVDLSIYKKIKVNVEKKISFIGRIHEQKGVIYLLEAFEKIKDKLPEWKLELIGKVDSYGLDLQKKFKDKRIIWRGLISDRKEIVKSLKSSYLIALPSLWEGLPLTLFEALASERPVIVSDIPAFKSVIKDEALYCKVKDSEDLAKKIMLLIDKVKAEGFGKRGKKLAEQYDWRVIADKLNLVYDEI